MSSSKDTSEDYKYPEIKIFNAAIRSLYKALLELIPETGLIEVDEKADTVFTNSLLLEQECRLVINQFESDSILNCICKLITDRDYNEKGGDPMKAELFFEGLYESIYNNNMLELQANGLSRYRLVDK